MSAPKRACVALVACLLGGCGEEGSTPSPTGPLDAGPLDAAAAEGASDLDSGVDDASAADSPADAGSTDALPDGSCAGCTPCVPGGSHCSAGAVVECASDGTELPPAACAPGETCIESGDWASCVPDGCAAGQSYCASTGEMVEACPDSGTPIVVEDCAAAGKVCVAGACVDVVCSPLDVFCAGNEVHLCSAKGDASTLISTCNSNQYCDLGSASCKLQVCLPNAPACNGNLATTCDALGAGLVAGGIDCSALAQVCSAGQCSTPICSPGVISCANGSVVTCNGDGLGTTLTTSCTASEYCDPAAPSCKPLVCVPNQPVCQANLLTTCNALGSGPLPGGSDCTPNVCSSGACTSALFFEDYEDGDYAGWWDPGPNGYQRWVTSTSGADGTTHSFCMSKVSGNYAYGGTTHTLPGIKPSYVGFWVKPTTKYSSFFELSPLSGSLWLVLVHYDEYGRIVLTRLTKPDITVTHPVGSWYQVELRNIDWQTRTFDYYVNGVLKGAAVDFEHQGAQISQIDFYHYGAGTNGCLDQILMQ